MTTIGNQQLGEFTLGFDQLDRLSTLTRPNTDKVSRLGVRRDWSANGGALVWNALDPLLHVSDAKASLDYPYVQSWIDALGPNTVIHEEFKPAKQRELLPTRAEHEAATRPVDRRYLPGQPSGPTSPSLAGSAVRESSRTMST